MGEKEVKPESISNGIKSQWRLISSSWPGLFSLCLEADARRHGGAARGNVITSLDMKSLRNFQSVAGRQTQNNSIKSDIGL